ncbi:hypothetical protein PM10SUCC1_04920 [Propionigenium maris DSM 9537]|uniref:chitinase n=1 Tax=Propionigenium maris DSM 9537 TaxID=1123000 RepID=A0A9W6LLS9_9FUSO|nr:glycosyl hydrolase family 18 protein [Propionigenium maris]GLI54977.1 hypothetical protein PM10SUCC1_04920 [Propionigenium maris DSM 9537]
MSTKEYYDKFSAIKATVEKRTQSIKRRYDSLTSPSIELTDKIGKLEEMVTELEIVSTLDYHLELKLLIQEIEKLLEGEEEGGKPLNEPVIKILDLSLEGEALQATPREVSDPDNTIFKYKHILNSEGIEREVQEVITPDLVAFETNSPGTYSSVLEYFYDLKDGAGIKSKKVLSNQVIIHEEVEDEDFPRDLPYSNTWAYATQNGDAVEVTLNNTWGTIGNKLGIYVNGQLKETQSVNYTALNKGSAKNTVHLTSFKIKPTDDIKVVYKVTFKREDKEDAVVYYKSTTGIREISKPGGEEMCKYTKWDASLTGSADNLPIIWHNNSHWKADYWINEGDVPGAGENGWKRYDYPKCPDIFSPDLHPSFSPAVSHLAPMDPSEVKSLNTPMEKMHITYMPEWAKWGARKYTPKISPWDKVSHMQYSFIDIRPDYTGSFDLDKDTAIHEILANSVRDCPNYAGTPKIKPNIFDPGAAFSDWGSTSAFHTEFLKYSRKYPYVMPLMSLGGWSRSGYFRDAARDANREFFVSKCIELMRILNMRGIDIDWEFPQNKREGDLLDNRNDLGTPRASEDEGRLFTLLMKDLRAALDKAGEEDGKYYHLACAVSAGKVHMANSGAVNWHKYCDFISYMTYDTHGAFDPYTNHQSYTYQNLQEDQNITNPNSNATSIEDVIHYVTTNFGIPRYKLVVGSPFYSRGWSGVRKESQPNGQWPIPSLPGLYAKVNKYDIDINDLQGRAAPGVMDGGRGAGVMGLRHLNALKAGKTVSIATLDPNGPANPFDGTRLKGSNFKYYYDSVAQVPYLFSEKDGIFYTYEDEVSLDYKSKFVVNQGLAGLISWDISLDDYGTTAHGIEGESYHYDSLELEDHLLTNVIFENFKVK